MHRAPQEARECHDAAPDDVVDVTESWDGTWQWRGFPVTFQDHLHQTKKVLDYKVMSKFCVACKKWENCAQEGDPDDVLYIYTWH